MRKSVMRIDNIVRCGFVFFLSFSKTRLTRIYVGKRVLRGSQRAEGIVKGAVTWTAKLRVALLTLMALTRQRLPVMVTPAATTSGTLQDG